MSPKNVRGKVRVIGPSRPQPTPIPLDPAAWKGGWVYGENGRMFWSDGLSWKSATDTEESLTLTQAPQLVTVGAGGDFPTINDALLFLTRFIPPGATFQEINNRTELRLLAGFVMNKPVVVANTDLSWVDITSVDAEVLVSTEYFDPLAYPQASVFNVAFLFTYNAPGPRIRAHFKLDYVWSPGQTTIGPDNINPIGLEVSPGSGGAIDTGGFSNFAFGVRANGGHVRIVNSSIITDSRVSALDVLNGGSCNVSDSIVRRARVYTNGTLVSGTRTPTNVSDFRFTAGVDHSNDIFVFDGAWVFVNENTLGGCSIPFNAPRREGVVWKTGLPSLFAGVIQPQSFTVATVPSAAAYPANMIHVSNGDSGAPCLAVSNGTNWLRIPLGAAVST